MALCLRCETCERVESVRALTTHWRVSNLVGEKDGEKQFCSDRCELAYRAQRSEIFRGTLLELARAELERVSVGELLLEARAAVSPAPWDRNRWLF